jgi:DNA-binding IclR family transcriptional regulator
MTMDDQLLRLLEAVRDGDFSDRPVDNALLAEALDLPLSSVASHLQEAKARALVSGTRAARRPGPWYTDLEVSVQGQRFLAEHHHDA